MNEERGKWIEGGGGKRQGTEAGDRGWGMERGGERHKER
jgi:hypothetical protein